MRSINHHLDQAEHQLDNDGAHRDCHDDKKEKVQQNAHKVLMEESLQPSNKLMNDGNTGADIIGIKNHDDDKREDATLVSTRTMVI